MNRPRILIAGTHSGVGKTSITLGLVSALTQSGLKVQTFKVGPDYLDPSHLAVASQRPCYNLDTWLMSHAEMTDLFLRASADADLSIIEGVMGLFDGASPTSNHASSAEIASILDCPVLLVADASGCSRSYAAMVHGFHSFAPSTMVKTTIANRCGSIKHASGISEALRSCQLPDLVGAIMKDALPKLPSRHLGLHHAGSSSTPALLNELATAIKSSVDLDRFIAIAEAAPCLSSPTLTTLTRLPQPLRIGYAHDEAFLFYYAANLELLTQLGCVCIPFSPIHDPQIPDDLDALYIGGGYPELFAKPLAQNHSMRASIRSFANQNRFIYGECGGLMYLSNSITDADDTRHEMLGLLPFDTEITPKLQALGYVTAAIQSSHSSCKNGASIFRGHVFHYSKICQDSPNCEAITTLTSVRNDISQTEGFRMGSVYASYAHLYFQSNLAALANLLQSIQRHDPTH